MKNKTINFWLILIISLSWALPIYGVVYNQINPNYGSALGVVYGFSVGCLINLIGLFLWVVVKRSKVQKMEIAALLISLFVLVILTALSNDGSLSKVIG